uniref:Uncharacterized protein n=1 Tax=viral metagenome TaxID=1070528 RepID=A0A6C0LCJ2_9ZZZZ
MQIKYGNADVTQLAIMNCMENNIIIIPNDATTLEYLFGPTSNSSISVNGIHYNHDIFIDFTTSEVYAEYPCHVNQPKIVVLIICHYSDMNMMMLEQLRNNIYKKHKVQYYIVASRFSETNPNSIELDDDIIFVNQKETYFNILNKTLKAMEYIDNILKLEYDFMIRTNVSTVINVPQLLKEMANLPKQNISIGGNKMQINWICPAYGINDNRYNGRWFVQGTSIIFSKDVCQDILKNQHKIEKKIVDDISLFMYLANFNPIAYESVNKYAVSFYECSESLDQLYLIPKNYAFYRNKSETMRDEDIIRMRFLCTNLQS